MAPFLRVTSVPCRIPDAIQAVLVTSANALAGLEAGPVPLLAVGDATAEAARSIGFSHVCSAAGDAEALAALAARLCDPEGAPLLLVCGRLQGQGLASALRGKGFSVLRRVVYRADPVATFPALAEAALAGGGLHAAMFLSAETARAFARLVPAGLLPALGAVMAVAIGKAAADALKPLPWRCLRVAHTPTLDGVLTLL